MTYNGWTNRATWCIDVWFNPESREDVQSIRDMMESDIEDMQRQGKGYLVDMLGDVNWRELEEHAEEEKEDTDE